MPRLSTRRAALRRSERRIMKKLMMSQLALLLALSDSDSDSDSDSNSDDEDGTMADVGRVLMSSYSMPASRHTPRTATRRPAVDHRQEWEKILDVSRPKYTDEEFLHHFRMDRDNFDEVLALIRDHPKISEPGPDFEDGYELSCSPELHLLVTLKYFGSWGNNDATLKEQRAGLGITKESVLTYVNRTVEALLSIRNEFLSWPDAEERKEISKRIETAYQFPNCVGFVKGTHLVLACTPKICAGDYLTPNEQHYALKGLVVSDDLLRIRHLDVGWCGSVEDSRVWRNGLICRDKELYFGPREYLLGDSSFDSISCLVAPYKKRPYVAVLPEHTWFNEKLSAPCSKSEDAIDIWKGRFPYIRNIRVCIRGKPSNRLAMKHVLATAVLHNLLVSHKIPQGWIVKEDFDRVVVDEDEPFVDDEEDDCTVTHYGSENGARRQEIHDYLKNLCIS